MSDKIENLLNEIAYIANLDSGRRRAQVKRLLVTAERLERCVPLRQDQHASPVGGTGEGVLGRPEQTSQESECLECEGLRDDVRFWAEQARWQQVAAANKITEMDDASSAMRCITKIVNESGKTQNEQMSEIRTVLVDFRYV